MTELGRSADPTPVWLAAENQAAADPRPERHQHDLGGAAGSAGAVLGDRRRVAVVVDEHGQPEPFGHHVAERDVGQRRVDPDDRDPVALVHQHRDPEPDRIDLATDCFADLADRLHRDVEQRPLIETRYRPLCTVVDSELRIYCAGQ